MGAGDNFILDPLFRVKPFESHCAYPVYSGALL